MLDAQSLFQRRAIPIPRFKPQDRRMKYPNYMGRLTAALLGLSDPRLYVYAPECTGWFSLNGKETAGISLFSRINRGVGVFGPVLQSSAAGGHERSFLSGSQPGVRRWGVRRPACCLVPPAQAVRN